MSSRGSAPPADSYSPQRRTALLLTGTGTAGAYHAGVLRALHEAGVKIDVVAARGVGTVGALFAAVDGAQRLWDERGFWRSPYAAALYPWRAVVRVAFLAVAVSAALVALPLAAMAAGLIVYPIDFILKMVGVSAAAGLVRWYGGFADAMFAPAALPTWLPRLVLLTLGTGVAAAAAAAWRTRDTRRHRGPLWWRLVHEPVSAEAIVNRTWSAMWDLIRGAAQLKQPQSSDLGRRYTEMLAENLGQPGFRELLIAVHDVDARRDLVFALVAESRRHDLIRRATTGEADARRAEILDLAGVGRDHLADAVAAALAIPLVTPAHTIHFGPDSYWRGEAHRLCDRPASLARLVEELARLDVEQVIIVSASPPSPGPHALSAARLDPHGRVGEYLQATEAAIVRDVTHAAGAAPRLFVIVPAHNPIGPLDFGGGFDDRSDRNQPLAELMSRGYEDAYHQFIEPVVGASGDRVGAAPRGRK